MDPTPALTLKLEEIFVLQTLDTFVFPLLSKIIPGTRTEFIWCYPVFVCAGGLRSVLC